MSVEILNNCRCVARELVIIREGQDDILLSAAINKAGDLSFPQEINTDEKIRLFCRDSIVYLGDHRTGTLPTDLRSKVLDAVKDRIFQFLEGSNIQGLEILSKTFERSDQNDRNIAQISEMIRSKLNDTRRKNKSCFKLFGEKMYSAFDMTKMSGSIAVTAATTTAGTIHGLYLNNKDNQSIDSHIEQSFLGTLIGVCISAALNGAYAGYEKYKQE